MNIEIWSDVICPWCYIGKRRIETALQGFGGDVTITFRAYQLDPSPVPAPVPIKQAMAAKFGGPARSQGEQKRLHLVIDPIAVRLVQGAAVQ